MHATLKRFSNWRLSVACLTFALAILAITTIVGARNASPTVATIQPLALTVNALGDSPDLTLNGICDTGAAPTQQWLNKLNQFNGNFVDAEMVKAFLRSQDYRGRFGL